MGIDSAWRVPAAAVALLTWAGATLAEGPQAAADVRLAGYGPQRGAAQVAVEQRLQQLPAPDAFRRHLERITQDPHIAGSGANLAVARYLGAAMEAAGLEVAYHDYDVYLPEPEPQSQVALVTPVRLPLNNQEDILPEDPYTAHPGLAPGWNAFSASGDVTAGVVYVNYGRKEDFDWLRGAGVSLEGKLALARYGGNYRGFKARYAEAAGALGVIIYTDPADNGYMTGLPYPQGTAYTSSTVERGSLLTMAYTGDPLTPFAPALPLDGHRKVARLSPEEADLPRIPVTPLPYGSAVEILRRMTGEPVPRAWQGGLPCTYRLTGGPELTVRLRVDQPKGIRRITDVVGTLRGSELPDEWIILGCHYDAWSFGAEDPNGGSAMLLTLAEALGQMAREGVRPRRTVMIAHWDAEEFGMIGSSEWVEQFRDELAAKAVAYINADVSVSGPYFHAAAAPLLRDVLIDATRQVVHPDTAVSVYQTWNPPGSGRTEPGIGTLGGGSDHLGFYAHLGIPAAAPAMSGASLYHSNYDDFTFFARYCDPRFEYGPTMARIDGVLALRLANADLLPLDPRRYGQDLAVQLAALRERSQAAGVPLDLARFDTALTELAAVADTCMTRRDRWLAAGQPEAPALRAANRLLVGLERVWIHEPGLQERPWNRSLYVAPDPFSGYDAWTLPGLRYVVETRAPADAAAWQDRYAEKLAVLGARLQELAQLLD